MITTRHSLAVFTAILLVLALTLGLGLATSYAESASEPTDAEKLARWEQMNQNINDRIQAFLATDEIMQRYGICDASWNWFQAEYEAIKIEEYRDYYADLYPDFNFDVELHAEQLREKYQNSTEAVKRRPRLSIEAYEADWQAYLRTLEKEQTTNRTAFHYLIEGFYNLRFADGELVWDALFTGPEYADLDRWDNDVLLSFLKECTVDEDGYLVHHSSDGSSRRLLAWYGGTFGIYKEHDFQKTDPEYLPNFN